MESAAAVALVAVAPDVSEAAGFTGGAPAEAAIGRSSSGRRAIDSLAAGIDGAGAGVGSDLRRP